MGKRILLCLSHSIEEYDQLKLLHGLGYEVASIGGYIDPANQHDTKRPPLSEIPCVYEVKDAVDALGTADNLAAAQGWIPYEILDWLGSDGVIIFHHYLDQRLWPQWGHLTEFIDGGGRIVWRTVGQSTTSNELAALPYTARGLEIVRYSPKETAIPGYAGSDALIRFYKDEDEWCGWTGEIEAVLNITQELHRRDPWTNAGFWEEATRDLPITLIGPDSENYGGIGAVPLEVMQQALREHRIYLYTGTQPASYTLGLLEALMTGIPVVSIGPSHMQIFPYGPQLFEGHELCLTSYEDAAACRAGLHTLIDTDLSLISAEQRKLTVERFGMASVGKAWQEFLG